MLSLARLTLRRAREERLPQVAGSLTLTTVLSIVPILAVGFALFARVRAFRRFGRAIENDLLKPLLPHEIAQPVLKHVTRFAENAGSLTWVSSLFVLVTAMAMLLTVENAFNRIWRVRTGRPIVKRLGLYLALLAVGPAAVGASLCATSYLASASAGLVGALPSSVSLAMTLGQVCLMALGSATLFYVLPNAKVRRRDALVGGLIAAVGFELGKRGFAAYLVTVPTYKAVYGVFAALPAFLLWVYVSWMVALTAAVVTANLTRAQPRARGRQASAAAAPATRRT